jgi:NHS family xanthosine MFS transporter
MAVAFVPLFKHKHDPHRVIAVHGAGDVDNP